MQVPLLDESDAKPELLETQHLIIFGGSHQNRLALELALRYRTFFVDASVPGDDAWLVTTHCGIHASRNNIVQLAASPEHRATALKLRFDGLNNSGDDLILKHIHRICHGKVMSEHFPSWEKFADGLP